MIRNRQQYEQAQARFEELFGSLPGSPEAAELDRLARALDHYEDRAGRAYLNRERRTYAAVSIASLLVGFLLGDAIYRIFF